MSSKKSFGFSSFQLPAKPKRVNNTIPPPPSSGVSKQGYSTMSAISQNALAAQWGVPRKRTKTEEEYFDEEDDDGTRTLVAYTGNIARVTSPSLGGCCGKALLSPEMGDQNTTTHQLSGTNRS